MKNILIIAEHNFEENKLIEFASKLCANESQKKISVCNVDVSEKHKIGTTLRGVKMYSTETSLHPHLQFIDDMHFRCSINIEQKIKATSISDISSYIKKNAIDTVLLPGFLDNKYRSEYYRDLGIQIKENTNADLLLLCM